ncbi:MAG: 2-oxo acid dehydrogenase subunit E2 [Clostridiales bacterium]|nr:2-oxo acid dehydrogenase subunit E2 [Clostridiales bacterium]
MATVVIMPRQGNSVESCIVAKWHKQVGDSVKEGDLLFTYETDKATFDEEATINGTLLVTFFEEGDDVPVLENMCVIGESGEDISSFASQKEDDISKKTIVQESEVKEQVVETTSETKADTTKISPRAKNKANKANVDISYATPSGPKGRIIERDIDILIKEGIKVTPAASETYEQGSSYEATGIGGRISTIDLERGPISELTDNKGDVISEYEEVKTTNIRKMIAKAMHNSLATMAQLTLNTSFDATAILEYRKMIKANGEALGLSNITINDLVVYAVSRTLASHRTLNAHNMEDYMKLFNTVHMGVAIDTDRGLMVPTIFNCDLKSLDNISIETKALAAKCKEGTISPDLLTGGTFTVTNLGALGIESFTPVVNPPQTAILGICGLETKVKVVNEDIKAYQSMGLSLTIDHRAVDGAPGAKFLKDLCANLENFAVLLAK